VACQRDVTDAVPEEDTMQYALLVYQGTTPVPDDEEAWATLSPSEQQAIYAEYAAINKVAGLSQGVPLGLPANATTVRVRDGEPVVTPGPLHGVEGAVGACVLFDADDLDAAIELASRFPAARLGGAVEVRPVEKYW
jgi:hypothetical protein